MRNFRSHEWDLQDRGGPGPEKTVSEPDIRRSSCPCPVILYAPTSTPYPFYFKGPFNLLLSTCLPVASGSSLGDRNLRCSLPGRLGKGWESRRLRSWERRTKQSLNISASIGALSLSTLSGLLVCRFYSNKHSRVDQIGASPPPD